jgi:hypothetical protein
MGLLTGRDQPTFPRNPLERQPPIADILSFIHSITSSAVASSDGGTSMPKVFDRKIAAE